MFFYKLITHIFHWIAPVILYYRLLRNKEDKNRFVEKLGYYHKAPKRPLGFVIRIHGASVGETLSSMPIIHALLEQFSDIHIMLTSNTLTSAQMMRHMLPARCFHVFAPLDTPQSVERFYTHYYPNLEIILDSEIWPNSLMHAQHYHIPVFGVNTRFSDKSMSYWHKKPHFFKQILRGYEHFFVQNEKIAYFLADYFSGQITICDNLKWAATNDNVNKNILLSLQEQCNNRFVVCLLSTHEAEEKNITDALVKHGFFTDESHLLIIVPRHPNRKQKIINDLKSVYSKNIICRSDATIIDKNTQIYLADSLGEIMLWSHLANLIFMGNSFSIHGGGHNPIEPAHIGKPLFVGNKIQNFTEIYTLLKAHDACIFADNVLDLVNKMMVLKNHTELSERLIINSRDVCDTYRRHSLIFLDSIYQKIIEMKNHAKP